MQNIRLPAPVVARLTKYLVHIQGVRAEGQEWVSSHEVASALGLTRSTVRQDLSYLDFSGTSRRGYETKRLEWVLFKELGADRIANVVIVGAGNLGRALALYSGFERSGFMICGIFDNSARVIGKRIGHLEVKGMKELSREVRAKKADIGMLTVPQWSAQEAADALVRSGVRGLLNLTPAHVQVPEHVPMVDVKIIASLRELLYRMKPRSSSGRRKSRCGPRSVC